MNETCCPTVETTVVAPEAETRPLRRPRYQIDNTAEAHTVRVELPGVAKRDVDLKLAEGILHLRAARACAAPESWKPLHRELSDNGYELHLRLNDRVDESRLSASLEDGVLTVVLPVKDAAKPRTIAIS